MNNCREMRKIMFYDNGQPVYESRPLYWADDDGVLHRVPKADEPRARHDDLSLRKVCIALVVLAVIALVVLS